MRRVKPTINAVNQQEHHEHDNQRPSDAVLAVESRLGSSRPSESEVDSMSIVKCSDGKEQLSMMNMPKGGDNFADMVQAAAG